MIKNSINKSYSAQENHYDDLIVNGELSEHAKTWLLEGTIDDWRHKRMYVKLNPLISSITNPKWLTVGDGRMGSDAHYLESKNVDVIATDISDTILSQAHQLSLVALEVPQSKLIPILLKPQVQAKLRSTQL